MKHNILLQGITDNDHYDAISRVLELEDLRRATISVAYMRASGLALIRHCLEKVAARTTLIVGIRNGVTTAQAFELGLELGCRLYAVDTGSRTVIYHPKIYIASNGDRSHVLIGSANLTYGGLVENVEASVELHLQHSEGSQNALATKLQNELDSLATKFPRHVTRIASSEMVTELFDSGRLIDESVSVISTPLTQTDAHEIAEVARIHLNVQHRPRSVIEPYRDQTDWDAETAHVSLDSGSRVRWSLVWESRELTRRHLNIPTGDNTNPTGSIGLGQGRFGGVDHRHYFRNTVFDALQWDPDERSDRQHLERAVADFQLIVQNVERGTYTLSLSHNTLIDTATYQQSNVTTHLHWGAAREHIAHEYLLGCHLLFYQNIDDPRHFLMEIDG